MGLMDKFKNLFTDEEVVDDEEEDKVEIKEVKKEEKPKLPTFMREKIAKEENENNVEERDASLNIDIEPKENISTLDDELKDNMVLEEIESKQSFKFPIEFAEDDFVETRTSRQSMHAKDEYNHLDVEKDVSFKEEIKEVKPPIAKKEPKVADLYKDKVPKQVKEDKKFRATPIISPIYGVLDKNYVSDEVESVKGRNLETARPSKSIDFDSVRKKAYGSVAKDIKENLMCENCEYLKEAKECRSRSERLENGNDGVQEEYPNITMDEAAENYFDYGVEYEKQPVHSDDVRDEDVISNYYLDDDEENAEVPITDYALEEESKNEIPPVRSSINLLSTLKKSMGDEEEVHEKPKKDLELTDDLFDLIDSMYDERNEDK